MATTGFPKWLLDGKEHISRSKEWNEFVEELYDAVQQQLKESHVQAFTDLTAPERQLFMERAAKAIHGGRAYGDLYDKVSESLDKHMNNEVARQLLEDYPINTKTDLILEAAQEGTISLLKKWPDMKYKLHICFNQPLPKPIRQLAWRLYLENTKVRKKYVDLLTHNPRAAISRIDFEISQKSEQLLLSEPTFRDLKGSVGAFYAMKAVLSYHHASKKIDTGLPDIDFLLAVPFVMVTAERISRREPAANHVVALLVEEYFTFLHSRPGYMVDSGSEADDKSLLAFAKKVTKNIQKMNPDSAAAIIAACVPNSEDWADLDENQDDKNKSFDDDEPWDDGVSDVNDENPVKPQSPKDNPSSSEHDDEDEQDVPDADDDGNHGNDETNQRGDDDNDPESNSNTPVPDTNSNTQNENEDNDGSENKNNNNNETDTKSKGRGGKIVATETGAAAVMSDIMVGLVRPLIRSLFVGYVNVDVLLFIWDQYIIGLDAPGFHDEYLPAVTATFFTLLSEHVQKCQSSTALESVLRSEGVSLKVPQFQYELKKHFGRDLRKLLDPDDRAALPVLDPTQANYRPWVYWFSDNIPSRATPQERHKARDERAAERERALQQQREEADRKQEEDKRQKFDDEQQFLSQHAEDRQRLDEDRKYLEDKLDEERKRRIGAERDAQAEIERLQMEIEHLKRQNMRSGGSVLSLESTISRYLIPPPPTAGTGPPLTPIRESKVKTPRSESPPQKQADDILTTLLRRVAMGFQKVGHGTGTDKQLLDDETREYILQHKEDVKAAELEVFGHMLRPGEFEQMTVHQQKQSSDKIMDVIEQKLQDRRQRDFQNSQR